MKVSLSREDCIFVVGVLGAGVSGYELAGLWAVSLLACLGAVAAVVIRSGRQKR